MGTYSTERSWLYISPFHFSLLEYHSLPSCYLHLLPFSLFKIWHQNRTQTGTSYFMTALSLSLQKAVRIPFSTPLLVNFVLYCHHHTAVIICMFGHWESALPPPPPHPTTIMVDWASLLCHHSLAVVLLLALSTCSIVVHLFRHCPLALLLCFVIVTPCQSCFVTVTPSLSCLSSSLCSVIVLLVIVSALSFSCLSSFLHCRCPACHRFCTVIVLLVIVSALSLSCLSSFLHCRPACHRFCTVVVLLVIVSALLLSCLSLFLHCRCPACHRFCTVVVLLVIVSALSLSCLSSSLCCRCPACHRFCTIIVLLVIFTLLCRCPACHRFCTVVVLLVIVSALSLSCLSSFLHCRCPALSSSSSFCSSSLSCFVIFILLCHCPALSSSFCSVIVLLCHRHSALSLSSCYVTHPPTTKTPAMSSPSSFSVSNLFSYCVKNPFVQQETSPPFGKWSLEAMQHGILLLTFQPVCKCRFTQ